jgi:hypothetical protein
MHVGRAAWVQCKDDNHLHVIAKKPTNQKAQTNENHFPQKTQPCPTHLKADSRLRSRRSSVSSSTSMSDGYASASAAAAAALAAALVLRARLELNMSFVWVWSLGKPRSGLANRTLRHSLK